MQIAVVGIDLGKNSCSIVGLDDVRPPGDYHGPFTSKTGCYLLETLNLHRQNFLRDLRLQSRLISGA